MQHHMLLATAFGTAAALYSGSARASTDNFAEIQIDAGALSSMARNALASEHTFCPYSMPCPDDPSESCVVDHFDLGAPGTWSRGDSLQSTPINDSLSLPGHAVEYHQPVTVHLQTLACAETPWCWGTTQYQATAVYELTMGAGGNLCLFSTDLIGAPLGISAPETQVCLEVNPDKIVELTGYSSGAPSGAAVSMSSDESRIAARYEFGQAPGSYSTPRINAWQQFLLGDTITAGADMEWSTYVHKSLFLGGLQQRLTQSLASVPGVQLTSAIGVSWTGQGTSGGQVGMAFDAEVDESICPNNLGASPFILLHTGINGAQTGLASQGTIDWNLDGGDLATCGFLLGGPIGSVVLVGIGESIDLDLSGLGPGCQDTGDATFACDQVTHPQSMALGAGHSATFELAGVVGSQDGVTLRGTITTTGSGALTTNVQVGAPGFGFSGNCNGGSCDYSGGVWIQGSARLCNVQFSSDPLDVFEVEAPQTLLMPASYTIRVKDLTPAQKAAYQQNPYGMRVTVSSSNGVKTHQIPPTVLLNDMQEHLVCMGEQIHLRFKDCLIPFVPPWDDAPWNPDWVIDPYESIGIEIMTAGLTRHLGYGLVNDLAVDVRRSRAGIVQSVTIRGMVYSAADESREIMVQELAIGVEVPRGMDIADDGRLIEALLPEGYSGVVELDPGQLPAGVRGAGFDLHISPEQLATAIEMR